MMKERNNDIEELIQNDIKSIQNAGARVRRESSLRKYYDSPNFCIYCSKMIIPDVGQSMHDVKVKKFCNRSCAASYNNMKRFGTQYNNSSIIDKCSDEFFVIAYKSSSNYNELAHAIGYKNNANSNIKNKLKDRINELQLEEYEDKKSLFNNMTKGELISKRSNWQSWRSNIQKNARKVYESSEKLKKCAVCGYSNTYEVAHIIPVADFNDDALISEINNIDNLIALCPNHHWEYDHNMLDLSLYESTNDLGTS